MEKFNLPQDKTFAKLSSTELFTLLNDTETNDYLCEVCDLDLNGNEENLYSFIVNN